MPKHLLEDMVKKPVNKKPGKMGKASSIKDIKRTEKTERTERIREKTDEPRYEPKYQQREIEKDRLIESIESREPRRTQIFEEYPKYRKTGRSRYSLWVVAFISAVFCFFAISFVLAKAQIIVNPKTDPINLNENFSATKDAATTIGGLSFNLVVIPGTESKTIQATGQKAVQESATGTVIIFNSFSASPQVLNINTKLLGSNGKIYKTQAQTTVPGISKTGTPGQVEVGIIASAPGPDYNSPPLDFTIVGFKGTAKYAKFIGRSKPDTTIAGGFIGEAPDVSEADMLVAQSALQASLQTDLLQKATAQIPDGFILFKNASFLNDTNGNNQPNITSTYNPDNSVTLTLSGTLYGILFNQQDLTQQIATNNIDSYDGSDVYIQNIKDLNFSLTSQDNPDYSAMQNINFNLSGPINIVWTVDTDKLMNLLLGKSKNDFNQIMAQYPNINSATLTISPIWKISIPDKAKNVKITVNYPQ